MAERGLPEAAVTHAVITLDLEDERFDGDPPQLQGIGSRLSDYILRALDVPFSWRTANCCHFVAGWIASERGIELESLLPRDLRAGLAEVHAAGPGAAGAVQAISQRLRCAMIDARHAWIGDPAMCLLPKRGRWALGIGAGNVVAFRTPDSIFYLPRELCNAAWPLDMIGGRA